MLVELIYLHLNNNKINKITNVNCLKKLEYLFLSNNRVKKIENLESLSILRDLDLSNNKIKKVENLENLTSLLFLDLDGNLIKGQNNNYCSNETDNTVAYIKDNTVNISFHNFPSIELFKSFCEDNLIYKQWIESIIENDKIYFGNV